MYLEKTKIEYSSFYHNRIYVEVYEGYHHILELELFSGNVTCCYDKEFNVYKFHTFLIGV